MLNLRFPKSSYPRSGNPAEIKITLFWEGGVLRHPARGSADSQWEWENLAIKLLELW